MSDLKTGKISVKDWLNKPSSPLLKCLSNDELDGLRSCCWEKKFQPGSKILEREGDDDSVYFIIEGCVHVLNYSASGRAITYTSLLEGDIFGEIAAIDGFPRSAWVIAISDCRVFCVAADAFRGLLESNHEFALILLKKLSTNLRASNERLTDIFALGAEQRACIELIRMAKPDPQQPDFYLVTQMPTHASFANMIGSSRETVSRIMSRLKSDAIISSTAHGLQIIDRRQLEKRAFDRNLGR